MTEDFCIGFFWAIGTIQQDGSRKQSFFTVRYKDETVLRDISSCVGGEVRKNKAMDRNGYFALTIPFENRVIKKMIALGWQGRMEKERKFPTGQFNQIDFIRGYCVTKLNIKRQKFGNMYGKAIRIYGAFDIVQNIDNILANTFRMTTKKVQTVNIKTQDGYNGNTYYVVYQSQKNIDDILDFLTMKIKERGK